MKYVIWSFTHRQWWNPGRAGYTPHLEQAGRYSAEEAGEIVTDSILGESVCICEPVAQDMGAPIVAGLWAESEVPT